MPRQSVTLSYSATPNSCTEGDLLEGVDVITLTGEINLEGQNSTDWNLDIPFQFRKNGALQFQTLCTVYMSSYCQTGGSECYCTSRSGNVYHFTFTRLAALWLSNSTAMTELAKLNTTDVIRAYTDVPIIHGKCLAFLVALKINETTVSTTPNLASTPNRSQVPVRAERTVVLYQSTSGFMKRPESSLLEENVNPLA
ncbi:uncharacterized protein LOC131953586 [Physella acuta]|uniref:uncharacterized protein LOC131953586 n=1 Tax=Physella acuta TaxID=109671 RepID=UPI0027DD6C8D|nr:uncharacterized protein LOC131953586 [Physella acuta]